MTPIPDGTTRGRPADATRSEDVMTPAHQARVEGARETDAAQSVAGEEDPEASMGSVETRQSLQQEREASKPRLP